MPDQKNDRGGDVGKHYAVMSNVPTDITNPQRKVRLIAAAWVVALVMCSVAGAYVAATIAIEQNDDNKAQLQAELEKRTRERDVQAERFQRALDQYRADQCRITARLPQDPDVVDIRQRYRCTNPVVTPPAPTQSPAAAPSPAGSRAVLTALPRRHAPPPVVERPVRPPAAGAPAPGPVPIPRPPTPVAPVPVPPVVPPLPTPGRQRIELLGVGVCLA